MRNSGISGNTTAMMLSRIQNDVVSHSPDMCIILAGTNDVGLDTDPNVTVRNLSIMIDILLSAKIIPVLCTIPPRNDNLKDSLLLKNNMLIRELAYSHKLTLLDFYSVLVDPETGKFKSGLNADNLHLNFSGSSVVAEYAKSVLLPLIPNNTTLLPQSNKDPHNLLSNALFVADANSDGVPDSWVSYGSAGVAVTIADKQGMIGKSLKMSATNNAGGNRYVEQSINISTGKFNIGDKIALCGKFTAELAKEGDVLYGAGIKFAGPNKGVVPIKDWKVNITNGRYYYEVEVPVGTTAIVTNMSVGNGTGDVYWGQLGLYNLTRMGMA